MKKGLVLFIIPILLGISILVAGCSDRSSTRSSSAQSIKKEFQLSNEKVELEKRSILSSKVEILIPKSFGIMSEEMAKVKYPSERRPTLIYTNEKGTINVSFNYTQTKIKSSELSQYMDSMKSSFKNVYPSAQWYKSEIEKINGKEVVVFELLTPAADTEIYNLMWYTDLDGKLLLSSFNCKKEQMDEWKEIARSIMSSQEYK